MTESHVLSDEAFDELEALLSSDEVPADCMNLEMLDGYLAALIAGPAVVPVERWMPAVWSADEDGASFGSSASMRAAIAGVLGYYNELATTLSPDGEWEPFCYAVEADSEIPLADEWVTGFEQGLELWPQDWREGLAEAEVNTIEELLDSVLQRWGDEAADAADADTRLEWLAESAAAVRALYGQWRALGRPAPAVLPVEVPAVATGGPGRNEPCPCGSGKKYKKCCGAAA